MLSYLGRVAPYPCVVLFGRVRSVDRVEEKLVWVTCVFVAGKAHAGTHKIFGSAMRNKTLTANSVDDNDPACWRCGTASRCFYDFAGNMVC